MLARRKAMLPLINKHWARALSGPSHAWRVVTIGCDDDLERHYRLWGWTTGKTWKRLDPAVVRAWFESRSG